MNYNKNRPLDVGIIFSNKYKKYIRLIEKLKLVDVPVLEYDHKKDSVRAFANKMKDLLDND